MCNFRFIAFRLTQLCGTELVPLLRCSFPVLFPGLPVMLILWSGCSPRSLQTGPGRRPGRTGPHIQPRDGLRPAQHQRDARRRRPGHMKATRSAPVLLSPPSFLPRLSHPPCLLPLHPPLSASTPSPRCRERKRDAGGGGSRGRHTVLSPPSSQNSQPVPRPLFSAPLPLLRSFSTWLLRLRGLFFSLLHVRLSVM